ncbi:MAG: C25 family cysteine peptidase [Bacteroidales bacterium]|nr:C25 family cysteine peptidase [Bacteroidales bacterium]
MASYIQVMRVNNRAIVLLTAILMLAIRSGVYAQVPYGRSVSEHGAGVASPNPSSITYQAEKPLLRKIDDPSGTYFRMLLPGHHLTSDPGKPELPVYSRLVEVPEGMSVSVSLSGVASRRINLSDYADEQAEIFPSQPDRTKNETQDEKIRIKDTRTYNTKGLIAHDTVVITHEGIYRGRRLTNIAIYPAFYNPAGRFIDLITSMKVDIKFEPSDSKGEEQSTASADKGGYISDSYVPGYTDEPVTMIIVTDSAFVKQIAPLIKWKMLKGIRSIVVYKESGTADTIYYNLKKKITEIYNSSVAAGTPVQYLLIAGDPSIIPTSRGTTNVSDLYYGEFDGEGDYIPELFIGRLPAADTTQLKGMVKKIINYETFNYNPSNNFWSEAVATAGNAPGFELYMNGQVQYLYNNFLGPDTSLHVYKWLYPDSPLKDDSLKTVFNKGLCLLNYSGHGEASGFSDPLFKASMVNALTNLNEYPLIISNACRTAQINVTPCFGTSMVSTPEKGALGFIGCTNDSYWTDDFYWTVGPGTPALDVTYDITGLGAFDRLFHNHGEPPGQWYTTMGQINFSGNMSVSTSTSPRKKYYWETYILLGDPSLTPVIGRPDTFAITVPDTIPPELQSLSLFADPFAYAAISNFDTLWDASFVSPSGNISLTIPDGSKDSCLLVVTGQNMVPFMKTIRFAPVKGAFLTTENIVFDDSEGNGDGIPDYGESVKLNVTIRNMGQSASSDLTATLVATSGLITVESDYAYIGVLPPGASYTVTDSFVFSVSDDVEDGELASLLLSLSNGGDEYNFGIDMTISAPQLEIISAVHDDASSGNSNFLPDPGETIHINVMVKNEGSSSAIGYVTLTASDPLLDIGVTQMPTDTIKPGEQKIISFVADISILAGSGRVIPFDVEFVCGNYKAGGTWSLSTGKTRETWEFNRFDVFPWIRTGDYPWTITSLYSFENTRSARSGIIPDNTESILSIYVNNPVADTLSFYARVSSESNYDELIFRIDSVADMEISGDTPWALRKKVLQPGVHLLEWIYKKDVSLSGGLDAAWIDQITFPDIAFLDADLEIDSVYPPPSTAHLSEITVKGRVINFGRTALTSFPLAYRINDGELVNETFYQKIDPGDTVNVAFNQKCSLQSDESYLIYIINRLPEDGYPGNDTAYVSYIRSGTSTEISSESVNILPNPFIDGFILELDAEGEQNAYTELIDSGGRVVMRSSPALTTGQNRIPFDCHHLANGVYTLRITMGSRTTSLRVVKT